MNRNEEIVRLYRDEGLTQALIGERFGITESRVCQILVSMGLGGLRSERRAREQALEAARCIEAEETRRTERRQDDEVLTSMWLAGASTAEIGKRFNIDRSVVGRRAKTLGLPQRTRGGWGSSRERRDGADDGAMPSKITDVLAEREIAAVVDAARCLCGGEVVERCGWCSLRLCEDCARMTSSGIRCGGCVAA